MESFGLLLSKYRRRCLDPLRGGMLTQERLAELLEHEANISGYTGIRISNWERGQETIRHDNRELLVGLIIILHRHGGFSSLQEANELLFAGGYRDLDEAEIGQVNGHWLEQPTTIAPERANASPVPPRPKSVIGGVLDRVKRGIGKGYGRHQPVSTFQFYPSTCGEMGIDLGRQRLLISTTFGSYFAGLLERQQSYVELPGQIITPIHLQQGQLAPIERIFWALQNAKGPRLLALAAEGGMGKSTLAAKIIRCLLQEQAIDMILGDSAKNQQVNLLTGTVTAIEPGYYDVASCYERLCSQLALPYKPEQMDEKQLLTAICDRLVGRRALIVLDNLETVKDSEALIRALRTITSRDIRAIITTRGTSGLQSFAADMMLVQLQPIQSTQNAHALLTWHIDRHQDEHPRLGELRPALADPKKINWLIGRTGGIPLLMQLVFSDIARYSWGYLDELPHLLGQDLLNFLYQSRWEELGSYAYAGAMGRQLLHWIAAEQYRGQRISLERIVQWGQHQERPEFLAEALRLLHERFLILNQDPAQGNFAVFPSLVEFLQRQQS